MRTRTVNMIELQDWDDLVEKTYGRPYSFQQQDDCKERGTHELTVPDGAETVAVRAIDRFGNASAPAVERL